MHYKCENCGKMIQDYWRMIKHKSKSGEEVNFCSDSCKTEYEKKNK
ncbi:MAG: hypothetical protein WC796_02790 [Candidatus Pacearchaeota archaeon]|jgi:hypothetical protein